jgi:hypothetical protein
MTSIPSGKDTGEFLRFLVLLLILFLPTSLARADRSDPLSLAGQWRFQLDRQGAGIKEKWFARTLEQRIQLPGALQNEGFGDDIAVDTKWTGDVNADQWLKGDRYAKYREPGNIKVPFWLQPQKHYVGIAWYQREFQIPKRWEGKRVVLTLERAHWETQAWLDGTPLGTNESLSTPHVYELGTGIGAGKHTLSIRVDNHMMVDVGSWAHSVSDHTQGNWNGLIGQLRLEATSPVWLDDVQVFPNVSRRSVRLAIRVGNTTGKAGRGTLSVGPSTTAVNWDEKGAVTEMEIALDAKTQSWDEFNPALQELTVRLEGDSADDTRKVSFGLREITTEDRQFILNGRPTFFRGTLECCIFPLTGYPPTDIDSWKRIIRVCQTHGLNHIRYHSWCPPEAAFAAADELGFYFSVEIAAWTKVGDGQPIDQWLYREADCILKAYGNHPSFVLMPYGNEPSGNHHKEWLATWVSHWRKTDPRRLYTSASGWPQLPENQYHVSYDPRGPGGWLGRDYRQTIEKYHVPIIVHEMGQWCVYPNFDEMKKYTGPLKPKNFEIFRDSLAEHGMLDQWRDFLHASGRLQVLCYKEEIEAALRTPGLAGIQLLDLHDFPGQGTALVGVLDPFWDSKGYVTAAEYRRFCNRTVPLARLMKRTWTTDETLTADVEVANYGPQPLENTTTLWKLIGVGGKSVASGEFPPKTLPLGQGIPLGKVNIDLSRLSAPKAYKLIVELKDSPFQNDWNIWVYPANHQPSTPDAVEVVSELDDAAMARLEAGGRLFLLPKKFSARNPKLFFQPIFWNRYMFNTQAQQTLGLLCNNKHPALADFPTDVFQDWQWEDILTFSRGMVLDDLPKDLRPIVQPIDDWNTNRKLGLLFECRVGKGELLVCSADLEKDLDHRPAARQLRQSLLSYLATSKFKPTVQVSANQIRNLLAAPALSGAHSIRAVQADSAQPEFEPEKAFDGDPQTMWHTVWGEGAPAFPHQIQVEFEGAQIIRGFTALPRQDGLQNGWIKDYEFYLSQDSQNWGQPVAKGSFTKDTELKSVTLTQPSSAHFARLVALYGHSNGPWASLAELNFLTGAK